MCKTHCALCKVQCFGLTSHPFAALPSQLLKPEVHCEAAEMITQAPPEHDPTATFGAAAQLLPHAPQFAVDVVRLVFEVPRHAEGGTM
jgi:hypothetical protein